MKSSIFLAASGAVLAMAGPLNKRVMETEVVYEYYTVTVTGGAPKPTTHKKHPTKPTTTVQAAPSTTTTPTVAPEPTSTTPTYVVVTVTQDNTPPQHAAATTTKKADSTTKEAESTTKTSSKAPAASDSGNDFISKALYHHNIHRSNHSAPAVVWNQTIADYAGATASTCKFAHDMTQGGGGYGQNLASWGVSSGAEALGDAGAVAMAATDQWYNGEFNKFLPSYYNKATPDMSNFEAWGHLSQMVWKDSTAVGCVSQFCKAGTLFDGLDSWFTVCNYYPPGNVGGAYGTNILAPQGNPTVVS